MSTPLTLSTGRTPAGEPTLTAVGEIDLSNADEFGSELAAAVRPGHRLVVDLTGVEYLDSAALACLFTHADAIRVTANPLLKTVLQVSGLADMTVVTISDSPDGG
jgi:anti-anti-sigma factor